MMILYKLDNLRERMNRDRFILPEDKDVSFFTNIFDTAVNWFNDIDSKLEIIKDEEEKKQDSKDTCKVYIEENKEEISIKKKIYCEKNKEKKKQDYKDRKIEYFEEHKEKKADTDKKYREKNKEELNKKKKVYRDSHKEEISETKKNWYENNKDKVIDRVKQNYENNREQKIEKVKEYSEKNKEKIKEQQSIKITCDCGVIVRKYGLSKHLQTEIHKENMEKI